MQTVGGNILHSTQDCRISLNSRRKPNILLFTRNSNIRPYYLLEYMGSSHINQSYFTWHTLTNELKSSLVLQLKVALPSLWQSTKARHGKLGDNSSRTEEYIPTMGCAPRDAALCRLQEKVTATNSRLCIRRRHNHLSPSLYHFSCVFSFGFCFHVTFCEEDPFEGKRQQLCRRSVCQMQPDIPCSNIGSHLGTISFYLLLVGHKTSN